MIRTKEKHRPIEYHFNRTWARRRPTSRCHAPAACNFISCFLANTRMIMTRLYLTLITDFAIFAAAARCAETDAVGGPTHTARGPWDAQISSMKRVPSESFAARGGTRPGRLGGEFAAIFSCGGIGFPRRTAAEDRGEHEQRAHEDEEGRQA